MNYNTLDTMFEKLTAIARKVNSAVTREMVECWVGNQGYAEIQYHWMKNTLEEIETGQYTAKELTSDIIQLCHN